MWSGSGVLLVALEDHEQMISGRTFAQSNVHIWFGSTGCSKLQCVINKPEGV